MPEETAKAIGEVMSSLAFGSAFWHASHTITGNIMDNEIIQILAFILHQTMVAPLNSSNPIINDLSFDEKPSSAVELNEQLSDMFLTKPVEEWDDILSNMDKPSYWRTFAGIVSTFFTLVLDDETADEIILLLADLFSFPDDEYEFINGTFLPAVRFYYKVQRNIFQLLSTIN